MTKPFSFNHEFTLDKSYFAETYDASIDPQIKGKDFIKTAIFAVIGFGILLSTNLGNHELAHKNTYYLGYFFIGLSVVEALSIKFKRTWWLWRQMMSKAANNNASLTLNEQGILIESVYVNQTTLWTDVYRISEMDTGFMITLANSKSYLSKRGLSEEAIAFIRTKI
ncbi:YcxB family protein [Shewanella subflava]|uniref:YcxB family protein n=1 Tax=Shewanella subflava TaxID=2986476 RepID=A0ABT3IB12_9GAMM|nr:YcxB family protein [Shewanella subflava]MCW3173236.1 YcxB family protein [Shewanella subflava]